jgi:hypothetical protein
MHAFAILLTLFALLPDIAAAQAAAIPQPTIPRTHVPGAVADPLGDPYRSPGAGVGLIAPVQGGGAVIVAPGQAPGYVVTPQNSWGAAIIAPGQDPAYAVPSAGGGTAIVGPGYDTLLVRPNPAGGTTIVGPNQPTTLIVPTQRGGSVILAPEGTGYVVPTPHGGYIQPPGNAPPSVILQR